MRHTLFIPLLLLLLLPFGCTEPGSIAMPQKQSRQLAPDSYRQLQLEFANLDYDLQSLTAGAPRFVLTRFPDDLGNVTHIPEKKRLFFLSLLPSVLMANEEIALVRQRMVSLLGSQELERPLSTEDRQWLIDLAQEYGLQGNPLLDRSLARRLLTRVDTLPPSLVLAQAANESAWGTSRFTRLANNIFGEWTFTPGTGIVPKSRPEGATYEVRRFKTVYHSLQSYMQNLNTHRGYRALRNIRAEQRSRGLEPTGIELARGLENYSIRRGDYVREIQAMIRQNQLPRLSRVTLRDGNRKS